MSVLEPVAAEEAGPLAREMAAAFRRQLAFYREHYKLSLQDAQERYRDRAAEYEAVIRETPPEHTSWDQLEFLSERDPAAGLRRWQEIMDAALDQLRSGHRAAGAVEGSRATPWDRAEFLAIRAELVDGWQPHNGIERQLIDTMAQAQAGVQWWLQKLALWSTLEAASEARLRQEGLALPPRLNATEYVEQAGQMVDRFNKIFLRTLRALRDLRRYAPMVVVKNAGQVNVGGQQVNVTG